MGASAGEGGKAFRCRGNGAVSSKTNPRPHRVFLPMPKTRSRIGSKQKQNGIPKCTTRYRRVVGDLGRLRTLSSCISLSESKPGCLTYDRDGGMIGCAVFQLTATWELVLASGWGGMRGQRVWKTQIDASRFWAFVYILATRQANQKCICT